MATMAEYAAQSVTERLARMRRTPDELAAAIRGRSDEILSRRPDGKNWAAKEVICHLRDVEEEYLLRFHLMLDNDDPRLYLDPETNEHWTADRQYLRNDAPEAVLAFRRIRGNMLALVESLSPTQLQRGCIHPRRDRVSIDTFVAFLASHDDEHLDQLKRALQGQP